MRRFGWFELGFTEDFLVRIFANAGFTAQRIECRPTIYGEGYTFKHRGTSLEPGSEWLSHDIESSWNNAEPNGRWTKAESRLYVDMTDSFSNLVLDVTNHHPWTQSVEITYGSAAIVVKFNPGERKQIVIGAHEKASQITIRTRASLTMCPRRTTQGRSGLLFTRSTIDSPERRSSRRDSPNEWSYRRRFRLRTTSHRCAAVRYVL
jgi:hypothetical protein